MPRGTTRKGLAGQHRVLVELHRRYVNFEAPPTWAQMRDALSMSDGSLSNNVRGLRERGLIHENSLWITRAGFAEIGASLELTNYSSRAILTASEAKQPRRWVNTERGLAVTERELP